MNTVWHKYTSEIHLTFRHRSSDKCRTTTWNIGHCHLVLMLGKLVRSLFFSWDKVGMHWRLSVVSSILKPHNEVRINEVPVPTLYLWCSSSTGFGNSFSSSHTSWFDESFKGEEVWPCIIFCYFVHGRNILITMQTVRPFFDCMLPTEGNADIKLFVQEAITTLPSHGVSQESTANRLNPPCYSMVTALTQEWTKCCVVQWVQILCNYITRTDFSIHLVPSL